MLKKICKKVDSIKFYCCRLNTAAGQLNLSLFNPASLLANTANPASLLANPTSPLLRAQYTHHHNLNNMTNGAKVQKSGNSVLRHQSPGSDGQQISSPTTLGACGQQQAELMAIASSGSEADSQGENKENNGNSEEVKLND